MANSKFKDSLKREEKRISEEIGKEKEGIKWFFKSHTFRILLAVIIFILAVGGLFYYSQIQSRTYIENSEISAPIISLSSVSAGILEEVFVSEGDYIPKDTIVARVNNDSIMSKTAGLVVYTLNAPGQVVSSQTSIVKMIEPSELRVVGHIRENKGLSEIRVGQKVIFTVDAFGSKEYNGIVESISSTSKESGLLFSISDKRDLKDFDVKIRFDYSKYPELKNGMSAKSWIYK